MLIICPKEFSVNSFFQKFGKDLAREVELKQKNSGFYTRVSRRKSLFYNELWQKSNDEICNAHPGIEFCSFTKQLLPVSSKYALTWAEALGV
jgi:hypothetical protein